MQDRLVGKTVYLDTNVIIYAFEAGHAGRSVFQDIFRMIDADAIKATTSELTLAEILTGPYKAGAEDLVTFYENLLSAASPLQVAPIDRDVLRAAARLRASLGLRLADAIHAATATQIGCDFLFTEDAPFGTKLPQSLSWLSLADFVSP